MHDDNIRTRLAAHASLNSIEAFELPHIEQPQEQIPFVCPCIFINVQNIAIKDWRLYAVKDVTPERNAAQRVLIKQASSGW